MAAVGGGGGGKKKGQGGPGYSGKKPPKSAGYNQPASTVGYPSSVAGTQAKKPKVVSNVPSGMKGFGAIQRQFSRGGVPKQATLGNSGTMGGTVGPHPVEKQSQREMSAWLRQVNAKTKGRM